MSKGSKETNDYNKTLDKKSLQIEDRIITGQGEYSHAEGFTTEANGEASHAEGILTIASGISSHAEGRENESNGYASHCEGYINISNGDYSHAEGKCTMATGVNSHSEGWNTKAVSDDSHAEGSMTLAAGISSHAEGSCTQANGTASHSEGWQTIANSMYSHAEGILSCANGCGSHAEGNKSIANGCYSHASGYETIAQNDYQTVIGKYNRPSYASNNGLQTDDAFIIGNGDITNTSNALRVTFEGNVYAATKSAYYSGGADYAEMFEWKDRNINNDDRIGYFVTLEEDKIRIANDIDDYILGVISASPSVVGDAHSNQWINMYLQDEWGRLQYEYIDEVDSNKLDSKEKAKRNHVPKLNPLYDNTKEYIPRKERIEWAIVGMLGKILIRDDGTCIVNGYCMPNNSGIATASQYGYRVLKRIAANQILILFR